MYNETLKAGDSNIAGEWRNIGDKGGLPGRGTRGLIRPHSDADSSNETAFKSETTDNSNNTRYKK